MKLFIVSVAIFLSSGIASGKNLLEFQGKFLIVINGASYHLYEREKKFDFKRKRNERHAAVGVEYEFKSDNPDVIKSVECINFKNSQYKNSNYCGGSYKMKDKMLFKSNYFGVKYGFVTGYKKQVYTKGEINRTVNKLDLDFTPLIYPSYWIRGESYELESSYILNLVDRGEDVFTFLIKIVL